MAGIINLLRPVLESDLKSETLANLLLSCVDQRAFLKDKSSISPVVGEINARLNASTSRYEGLLLLQSFLPQCSEDILSRYASLWMQFCLKATSVAKTAQLAFTVLGTLLKLSEAIPEVGKHVSSNVVASLAETVHEGILPLAHLNALKCLEQCMKSYNGPCGPHRKVIEKFLFSMLDYSGHNTIEVFWQNACCMALLPQIGGGGVGGGQYKWAWASQQKILCRTIHLILDELYADSSELQVTLMGGKLEGTEPLPLPTIVDTDPVLRSQKLTARLFSVSACLQAMLVQAFPVPKNVSASSIMSLISRGLAVNGPSLGSSNTTHCMALAADLPKIHYHLLKVLEALILIGGTNMLPFSALICKLVVQTLKWTSVEEWPYGSERPYSFLRIQAYNVLRIWCGVAGFGSGAATIAPQFIQLSMHDIYLEKDTISLSGALLKNNKQSNQKQSKRRSAPHDTYGCSPFHNLLPLDKMANKELCAAALQAMIALIMSASLKMQTDLHKVLQETVVTILLKVHPLSQECPIPYSQPEPRLEVYRLLLQLVLDSHPLLPPPTNVALKLFSNGLCDPDVQVSMFCRIALSSVEKIIHPAYPSLHIKLNSLSVSDPTFETPRDSVSNSRPENSNESNLEVIDAETTNAQNEQNECTQVTNAVGTSTVTLLQNGTKGLHTSSPLLFKFPDSASSKGNTKVMAPHTIESETEVMNLDIPCQSNQSNDSTPQKTLVVHSMKQSPKSSEKEPSEDVKNVRCGQVLRKDELPRGTIDLTGSDFSDQDISEVPCEVDLADSDDAISDISICSRSTVNTPVLNRASQAMPDKAEKSSVETSSQEVESQQNNAQKALTQVGNEDGVEGKFSSSTQRKESSGTGKRLLETETEEGGTNKKSRESSDLNVDDEFDVDEEAMLLAFVDVTRDEEEGDLA